MGKVSQMCMRNIKADMSMFHNKQTQMFTLSLETARLSHFPAIRTSWAAAPIPCLLMKGTDTREKIQALWCSLSLSLL